jgi:hypothetical protein
MEEPLQALWGDLKSQQFIVSLAFQLDFLRKSLFTRIPTTRNCPILHVFVHSH